jgi:flagellar biogenesis protein FliO
MPPSNKNIMKRIRMLQVAKAALCLSLTLGPAILAASAQTPATPPRQTFTPPYAAPGGPAYSNYGEASTSTAAPQRATSPVPSGYAPNPTLQFREEQQSQGGVLGNPNPTSNLPTASPGVGFSETDLTTPPVGPAPTGSSLNDRTALPLAERTLAPEDGTVQPVVYDRTSAPSVATPTPTMSVPTSSAVPVIAQSTPSPAQQNSRTTPPRESKTSNSPLLSPPKGDRDSDYAFADGHPFLTMSASLFLVLGGFFILAWFVRRMAPQAQRPLPREVVEVLGRSPLGPRRQLQLIRFGGKLVLTSVSNDGVQPISEVTDPDEVQNLTQQCRRKVESETAIATQPGFRQFIERFKHQAPRTATTRQSTTSESGPLHGAHATPAPHETEQDEESAMSIDNLAGLFAETRHEGYADAPSRSVPLSDLRSM